MLASIHPLGERARGNRWGGTATAYLLGSVFGGVVLGGLAGLVGFVIGLAGRPGPMTAAVLVAAGSLLAAILDLRLLPVDLPTWRRQVNEDWLGRYRGWVYGAGFGFQLGLGVVTIVTTASVYLVVGLSVLVGMTAARFGSAVAAGTIVGAVFGLVRALPMLVYGRSVTATQLRASHRIMDERAGQARWVTVIGLAGVAVAACYWRLR